ncbi:MAG TPA: YfiR family protein [Blastocatellia bacterium]
MNSGAGMETARRPRLFQASILLICEWAGLTLLAILLSPVNFVFGVRAQTQTANEYEVKAAFLYNFAKFVEWPPEAFGSGGGTALIVGIIGDDPFGSAIDRTISGKTVNGRQLTIRRLKWGQNLKDCHVLFVSSSEQKRLPQILEILKGASVLTVSEMDQFSQQGGVIGFVMENSKVRFEINTSASEQARLKISSKLLALARIVRSGKAGGKK